MDKNSGNLKAGFTLLEILLVIAIIAILAGITIVAINPQRQLASARNAQRQSDARAILDALGQYALDNADYPTGITSSNLEVCNSGTNTSPSCSSFLDLSDLVPTYLSAIPADPSGTGSTGAGYAVREDASGRITVSSMHAENSEVIVLTR